VRDRKRRQWFQERNFAEAATEHGFKRSRWRGLEKQTIQDQLIAAIQNLKILIHKGGFTSARLIVALTMLRKALWSLVADHFYPTYDVPTYSMTPFKGSQLLNDVFDAVQEMWNARWTTWPVHSRRKPAVWPS
jgi:hypothetical protein